MLLLQEGRTRPDGLLQGAVQLGQAQRFARVGQLFASTHQAFGHGVAQQLGQRRALQARHPNLAAVIEGVRARPAVARIWAENYGGGPVGIETLAAALSEGSDTLEEVYEPYLIMQGFLKRTPRGREATDLAYKHIGKIPPAMNHSLFS